MTRNIRLVSGLILLAYVSTHLANHALGLISLEAMEWGRPLFLALWRNPVGTAVAGTALTVHFSLALWAIYERRRLRMSIGELVQLLFGIAIPLLLIEHAIGTRASHEIAGTNDTYAFVLLIHWKTNTEHIATQIAGLVVAWVHGCIGMFYWLRLKAWFQAVAPYLLCLALLTPVLALLGYTTAGREVLRLAQDPEWIRAVMAAAAPPDRATGNTLLAASEIARFGVVGLVLAALVARLIRSAVERLRGAVHMTYPGGRMVSFAPGPTILDISRRSGEPHAAVCGGRGRCSTCRIRVTAGYDMLPPVSAQEARVLKRIGSPINVRLACQTCPSEDLSIIPLLPPTATAREGFGGSAQLSGEERDLAILFADLRSFTQFAETKLPYDVVFVLNRYFAEMGEAIEGAGGRLDKFIGDGIMALFGVDSDPSVACGRAVAAARAMSHKMAELNETLSNELEEPLRIGIGIHVGPAIVGEMGYGSAMGVTAIGDAVNTASRLEAMTKEFGAQAIISEDVAQRAGVDLSSYQRTEMELRGKSEPIPARVIVDARDLEIT